MDGHLMIKRFLGKPVCRSALRDDLHPPASSFVVITKWAARTSGKQFDIESPNFTGTSAPTCSTAASDMTPPAILLVGIYQSSNMTESAVGNGLGWNLSVAAFCLAHPLGWLLAITILIDLYHFISF